MNPAVRISVAAAPDQAFLDQFPEVHSVVLHVLFQRGMRTHEEIEAFLNPDYSRDQHDPWLFKDMQKVVDRIIKARDAGEQVLVYGDYDADGVCASTLLYTALKEVGVEHVSVYLPHRDTEGYGLNKAAIDQFAESSIDLIITVDCGISNAPEITYAKKCGIEVIVTDHHAEPPALPTDALAVINPTLSQDNYPFYSLAGVGVAFKVAQALGRTLELGEAYEKWLLDLVAVSTVTDCMPLLGENRTLVKYGLIVLNKTRRPGLQALIKATHNDDTSVDTTTIGYRIGPWLNAAGRMDHANVAVQLLLETDPAMIEKYVEQLRETNERRKSETEIMFTAAKQQAAVQADPVLYSFGADWPLGLVGLVAGKLVSQFQKPAFVMTENNSEISGSGRSVPGLNMIETLQGIDHLFTKYGGHAMACGFTLKPNVSREEFAETFNTAVAETIAALEAVRVIDVVAEIQPKDITWELVNQLEQLRPFGQENLEPKFLLCGVTVVDFQTVGKTNAHLRMVVSDGQGKTVKAIGFGFGKMVDTLQLHDTLSIVCTLSINHWNGNSEIQMVIEHIEQTTT